MDFWVEDTPELDQKGVEIREVLEKIIYTTATVSAVAGALCLTFIHAYENRKKNIRLVRELKNG